MLKKNGRVVKIAFYVSKLSLQEFRPESERNSIGLWSVKVRRVVKTQLCMSDGSFLGNKFIERFAGFKHKIFSDVCQNCFLSSLIGRGDKTPFFKVRRNTVEMYVLEHFPQFKLKFFSRVYKTAFCREFSLTIWEKFFSAFASTIVAICQQKWFCQSLQNFNSRDRRNILGIFFRLQQRFLGVWEQNFGTHARTSSTCPGEFFGRISLRALRERKFGSF